LIKLVLKTKSI